MRLRPCSQLIHGILTVSLFWGLPAQAQDAEIQRREAAYETARANLAETQTRARTSCAAVEAAKAEEERARQDKICVTLLRPELEAMQAEGVSRADQRRQIMRRLAECQGSLMEPVLVAQQTCIADLEENNVAWETLTSRQTALLAALRASIAATQIRRAEIQAERARLQAEIEASRARQRAMLAEAERILQNLATR